ncbi:MAG: endo alpha-1,4 polygalactosaminidase [Lachnospiraceae bacterium]|nr:endo alpha-1,4 polygalactosaminidase [Lachnospiraceae bacterium]
MKRTVKIAIIISVLILLSVVGTIIYSVRTPQGGKYAVLLGVNEEDIINRSKGYDIIVVDGIDYSKETVEKLKGNGKSNGKDNGKRKYVYAYLSIGSLENYRSYYDEFKDITIGEYENWPDEYWVDVSDEKWQRLIVDELGSQMLEKGFDGLFLDNADVYYNFPTDDIYEGLFKIIEGLDGLGMNIMINGGDMFVSRLIDEGNEGLIDAINQESVFSSILDYENDKFGAQSDEENEYFVSYTEEVSGAGIEVYLLEYTKDKELIKQIDKYCREKGFTYYISDTVNLT